MSNGFSGNKLRFGNGTAQGFRLIPALRPEFVQIDDRTNAQLLAYLSELSEHIQFYDGNNTAVGDWSGFYSKDISVILARIVTIDLEEIEYAYSDLVDKIRRTFNEADRLLVLKEIFDFIFKIIVRFDDWYNKINQISIHGDPLVNKVNTDIYNLVKGNLSPALNKLYQYVEAANATFKTKYELSFQDLNSIWEFSSFERDEEDNIFHTYVKHKNLIDLGMVSVNVLYRTLHDTLSYVVYNYKRYFKESIDSISNHLPDIGLVIASLKVFETHQSEMNQLSSRFLDFYYKKVLQQEERTFIPDKVYLNVNLATNRKSHLISKGTLFEAFRGDDSDHHIYEAIEDLEVNHAKIGNLRTLFLSKGKRPTITDFEVITNIYHAPVANSKDGVGTPMNTENEPWPTFGEDQFDKMDDFVNMKGAEIGFGISSPILSLREGNRQIDISFYFEPKSTRIYKRLINDIKAKGGERFTDEDAFYKIFNLKGKKRNLEIQLSTARGWATVDSQQIKMLLPNDRFHPESFTISFMLDTAFPPVTNFKSSLHPEEKYHTKYPVLKVLMSDDREPYPFTFIQHLKIQKIDINVSVDRLRRFQVYNSMGQVDSSQPFYPFGPNPAIGSYFLVGNSEMFKKPLTAFSLNLEWLDLPKTAKEFEEYYKPYGINSDDFKVSIETLKNKEFEENPNIEDLTYTLFSAKDDGSKKAENQLLHSNIEVNPEKVKMLNIQVDPNIPVVNNYDENTQNGFLKIELESPEDGFGHLKYQEVVMRSMAKNATFFQKVMKKGGDAEEEELEVPNAPVNPIAKSIVASYSANCSIDFNDEIPSYPLSFFHVHPFGLEKTYPRKNLVFKHSRNLLPPYSENGYLFIGLEQAKPGQVISFYFELKTVNIREQNNFNLPKVSWDYLTRNNQFVHLDESFFLSDTTDQFTKSGLIKVQLPRDISSRGSILPNGMYWLRVSVFGDTELLCHTIDVRTQGITARWVDDGNSEVLRTPLPPNSIADLLNKSAAIRSVEQGFESFGGKSKESEEEFFSRVSERLRHKERVITHWDLERIVLDKFHDIHQVKCISYLSDPKVIIDEDLEDRNEVYGVEKEDGLTLVVVPKRSYYLKDTTPVVNFKKLQEIENEIKKYLSPFVKLKVRNPIYEYIRINCKIKFDDNSNSGHLINKLKADVKKLVSPWTFDHKAEIRIGTNLYLDTVFNYIQSLPYVDFVTKFSLLQIIEGDDGFYKLIDTANLKDQNIILRPSKPWTVFVIDEDHGIEIHDREEIDELPEPVKPPVSFKTRHNILKRSKFIKILWPKDDILEKEIEEDNSIYTVNIKI